MTTRIQTLAATVAAFTAAVAVAVASSDVPPSGGQPPRTAVIVDAATPAPTGADVVRVSSAAEARVAAARLAVDDYARIDAAGPLARAGLAEARAAGLLATR